MPDLEPGIVEKLVAAGITTVESVADMTPEQLEEVPGIGPKTVEKISIAVNNYFASLDAAANGLPDAGEAVGEDVSVEEEARDPAATESGESDDAAGEASEEVEAAERDDAETGDEQLAAESDVEPSDEGGLSGDEEGLPDDPVSSRRAWKSWPTKGSLSRLKSLMASKTRLWPMKANASSTSARRRRTRMCPTKKNLASKDKPVTSGQWSVRVRRLCRCLVSGDEFKEKQCRCRAVEFN